MYEELLLKTFFRARFERDPNRIAVMDYDTGREYSYGELANRSGRIAGYLKGRPSWRRGDRVALCARNGPWSLELFYAMPLVGGILSTYNCMLKEAELVGMLVHEAPRVVFFESAYAPLRAALQKVLPETHFVRLDGPGAPGEGSYEEALGQPEWTGPWAELDPEDICMLLHTGGTTGVPKAAKISYRALLCNTVGQVVTYSISEADIAYISFPFFHCAAWNSALPILLCGGKVVLKRKFDAEECLRMVSGQRLTFLAGSPSVFRRMLRSPLFHRTDFSSVRSIRCGSATPTLELMRSYWEKGLLFYNGYGMTEAGPGVLSLPASSMSRELAARKAGSVGKPMIFTSVRIVDDAGRDVPAGVEGELLVRGCNMFSGYWDNSEEMARAVRDGWLYTGDIARRDEDGFYFICGRKKQMFISGGENVYPIEIETALLDQPDVEDACVFGVPDEDWGEVGKAIVVRREGSALGKQELLQALAARLSTIKVPRYIQFVDRVPRSDAGKIMGEEVRERYGVPGDSG